MKKGEIKINRVGEVRTMKCGLQAEVISFRGCMDIDIRFKTGTIREHVKYRDFKACKIAEFSNEQKRAMRVAEVRTMNCGMDAMITDYRRSYDIDVEFEDESVKNGAYYSNFKKGSVRPSKKRVGEKRMMNCGLSAEIVAYRGNKDIDVRFEDGSMRERMTYYAFAAGAIAKKTKASAVKEGKAAARVGEVRTMNCGLSAEIIAYHGAANMDVRFSDGSQKKHVTYASFVKGSISPDKEYVGEIRTMRCGLKAEVIAFRNSYDIDIKFVDSGLVKKGVSYNAFVAGMFKAPVADFKKQSYNSLADMCAAYNIKYQTYYQRMKKGWNQKQALLTPVD